MAIRHKECLKNLTISRLLKKPLADYEERKVHYSRKTSQAMYVQRNIEVRSREHCCSEQAMSVIYCGGAGSSVGIATVYGLDGPGSNPSGDEIFRPSRPALGTTQPRSKWVPGLSRG